MSEPQNPQSKEGPHALPAALLHDLRTPLNQILGYSALLMEQAQEQGQDGFVSDLQKTQRAGRQLLTLIDDNFHSGSVRTTSPQLAPQSAIEPGAGESGEDPVPGERLSDGARGLILVVDDIEANRDVLSRRLKRQGHTVTTAENGSQALQSLRESVFDLVLLDIMMPEMDGYEVLRRLKADPALGHIPVIMISALNELDSVVRCIELGAEDYLPKPFNPILLKARIGACLEKKRSRDRETQDHRRMQELAGALALQNSEMTRWRKALEADLAVARRTQQALILSVPPLAEGWQVEVVYKPLIQVGGDAYGWRQLDNEVWLFWLADATGHGVAAALLTTLIASLFKRASDSTISAHGILARVNEEFHKILDGSSFMTACCAVVRRDGRFSFAGAGHPPLLIRRRDGVVEALSSLNPLIGIHPKLKMSETVTTLAPGDVAILYTDGLHSQKSGTGERFTHETVLSALSQVEAGADILPRLIAQLVQGAGTSAFDDDVAAIALHRAI